MEETVAYLRERITRAPAAVLVLGSGLGTVAEELSDPVRLPYAEIPGFPRTTVDGHAGALTVGILEGVELAVLTGRWHLYEGWSPSQVVAPLRALSSLGANLLLLTNAAGGIRPGMRPGDLMIIADHLNLMGRNPLVGPSAGVRPCFPDMSAAYDPEVRRQLAACALGAGISVDEGVYAALPGPSYETPAEIAMLRRLGADAVGMSTVPEVIAARALEMRVGAISCITNVASGLAPGPLSHAEVLRVGAQVRDRLATLLRLAIPRLAAPNLATEA
ncbi:MAG TPA: purine-nucleoside phosphorylase [Longimicrobiaceae bacterium]